MDAELVYQQAIDNIHSAKRNDCFEPEALEFNDSEPKKNGAGRC